MMGLAYEIVKRREDGRSFAYARLACRACGAHDEVRLPPGRNHNPEQVGKAFAGRGWEVSPWQAGKCRCPACIAAKPKNDPDALLRRLDARTGEPQPAAGQFERFDVAAFLAGLKDEDAMAKRGTASEPKPTNGPSEWARKAAETMAEEDAEMAEKAKLAAVVREPTAEHRLRIRRALDEHFDDAKGCYLDGMTDQRLGDNLKVPWKWIEQIREAAYGPIRTDPEIEAVRGEIVAIKAALAKAEQRLAAVEARFKG